jgi:hypothetical protein
VPTAARPPGRAPHGSLRARRSPIAALVNLQSTELTFNATKRRHGLPVIQINGQRRVLRNVIRIVRWSSEPPLHCAEVARVCRTVRHVAAGAGG